MIEEFKDLYKKEINEPMSEELNALFDQVLNEEFDGDHEKMDDLINSIREENTIQEPSLEETVKKLQSENEALKGAIMEMSSFMMGGDDSV